MVKSEKVKKKGKKLKRPDNENDVRSKNVSQFKNQNQSSIEKSSKLLLQCANDKYSSSKLKAKQKSFQSELFDKENNTKESPKLNDKKKKNNNANPECSSAEILQNSNIAMSEIACNDETPRNSNDDMSSDESDISIDESKCSVSSFNIDSYPSDDDDDDVGEEEEEKKRGIPFKSLPSSELEERENRTIFVGNLPKDVERNELKNWFSRFGKVQCVRLRSAPIADLEMPRKVAVIKKSFHQNRTNIHAYVRFKDVEGTLNSLQANGIRYHDHTLRVDRAKHVGAYDTKKAVFIGNVPFNIEEDSLISFFQKCGEIESVRIVRDKETGIGKGFAYVNFKCSSSIPLALRLDGEVLDKRQLRVKPVKYNGKVKHKMKSRGIKGKFGLKKGKSYPELRSNNHQRSFRNTEQESKFLKFSPKNNKKSHEKSGLKKKKFQGEFSKRKESKPHKKKSSVSKKREIFSKILLKKKTN